LSEGNALCDLGMPRMIGAPRLLANFRTTTERVPIVSVCVAGGGAPQSKSPNAVGWRDGNSTPRCSLFEMSFSETNHVVMHTHAVPSLIGIFGANRLYTPQADQRHHCPHTQQRARASCAPCHSDRAFSKSRVACPTSVKTQQKQASPDVTCFEMLFTDLAAADVALSSTVLGWELGWAHDYPASIPALAFGLPVTLFGGVIPTLCLAAVGENDVQPKIDAETRSATSLPLATWRGTARTFHCWRRIVFSCNKRTCSATFTCPCVFRIGVGCWSLRLFAHEEAVHGSSSPLACLGECTCLAYSCYEQIG
jgi:hypothetical protein